MKKIISALLAITMSAAIFTGCAPKKSVNITSAADLNGLTVGCQIATTGEAWLQENCPDKGPKSFNSGMDAALDLKNGNIDAIVIDELPAKSIIANNPDLKILDIDFKTEEYAIAVAKGNTDLLNSINAAIKKMKDDGTYDALKEAFTKGDGEIKVPDDIKSSGTQVIKMGTNAEFKPFEYVDGNKTVGFDISMAQYIAADMNRTLQIADMTFESLISALQAGTVDFVAAGMTITEDKLKNVDFSDPYYSSKQVIIVKK